jgi:hypothetical protein
MIETHRTHRGRTHPGQTGTFYFNTCKYLTPSLDAWSRLHKWLGVGVRTADLATGIIQTLVGDGNQDYQTGDLSSAEMYAAIGSGALNGGWLLDSLGPGD